MAIPYEDMNIDRSKQPTMQVATVEASAPLRWLQKGYEDFRAIPLLSMAYGLLFAGVCALFVIAVSSSPINTLAFLTGLVLVGPFVAAGLYVASRDLENGNRPSISRSLRLLISRRTHLGLFALMLSLIMVAWTRMSALIFAIQFNTLTPSVEAFTSSLTSADGWIGLAFFAGVGFVLVAAVFTLSVVTVPSVLDRDVDFISAMKASYQSVKTNAKAMAIWAGLIALMTGFGIATALVGLVVVFPVLGYATWHSYRELVR